MQMWVTTIHRIHIGSAPDYAARTRYPPDAQQVTPVRATSQTLRHSGPVLRAPSQQAARDQQVAVDRALHRDNHWPLIQAPTLPITAMTATSRRPRSTVYSTKEAPSSSLPRRRTRVRAFDMRHSVVRPELTVPQA